MTDDDRDDLADDRDSPETRVEYRVVWRYADRRAGLSDRWTSTADGRAYRDRAEAEAAAERLWRSHHAHWPDKRNFAVVRESSRPVRLYPAPMGAG